MNYRPEIDGLRALAVLPVILFHAGYEAFSGGFVGVDVFFVISGYLITTIIIAELDEGKFSLVNFYERRARRILPALFFVMAACIPFAWALLSPAELKSFGQSLIAVSTFTSNILFWQESGYFDIESELKPLLHTWSLAVEEQYYILFPLFLMFTWHKGLRWVVAALAIVFLFSFALAIWGSQRYQRCRDSIGYVFPHPLADLGAIGWSVYRFLPQASHLPEITGHKPSAQHTRLGHGCLFGCGFRSRGTLPERLHLDACIGNCIDSTECCSENSCLSTTQLEAYSWHRSHFL